MKKISYLLAAGVLTVGLCGRAYGQDGILFSTSDFSPTDLSRLSYTGGTPFGTARSAAMGGAFTSLGADLSSMHINPAGLGMYQSSEFGVTPFQTIGNLSNSGVVYDGGNRKGRFSIANAGAALNLYQGGGSLTSFTFGFGVNRLVDFNTNNRMEFGYNTTNNVRNASKLGDAFVYQLDDYSDTYLHSEGIWGREYGNRKWGAILARRANLIEPDDGQPGDLYGIFAVGPNTRVYQQARINTRGSVSEYNISGGFNFQNKFYMGFSIGIQDIYYKQNIIYNEFFDENDSGEPYPAEAMYYDINSKITGSGVNFKFGMIFRPVEPLRIGLSVHTPTYANVDHYFSSYMDVAYTNGNDWARSPENKVEFDYSTPTRLLGGISYTFGTMGVLAVDYERTWYQSMRYRTDEPYKDWFNDGAKSDFKGTSTVRIGGELRPFDGDISVRAGLTYTDSMVDIDLNNQIYNSPVPKESYGASAGVGFRIGRASYLDLTYAFNQTKYTDYLMYQFESEWTGYIEGGNPTQKINRHTILASLGFRF